MRLFRLVLISLGLGDAPSGPDADAAPSRSEQGRLRQVCDKVGASLVSLLPFHFVGEEALRRVLLDRPPWWWLYTTYAALKPRFPFVVGLGCSVAHPLPP